ncbi:hypothetical protein JYT93_00895 [bacterium AH-315-J19]|nr:hypothetical protein [bacterium AH-315-J19]
MKTEGFPMKVLSLAIFVIYFFAIGYAMSVEDKILPVIVFTLAFVLVICVYFYWIFVPAKFAKERHGQNVYFRRLSILLYVISAMFLVILVSAILQYSNFINLGKMKYFIDILGAFLVLSLIYGFILGAKALIFCEKPADEIKTGLLVWTVILYFYLPVGMFFLSPRLDKLKTMGD